MPGRIKTAVFGGGCFWCTEAVFQQLKGVLSVTPGYAGGRVNDPTYEQVCTGTTGHAEVIRIEYDPSQTSFRDLLAVFFATHDPTTPNRQGYDVGTQYRSILLYADEDQKRESEAFIRELNESGHFESPVVTELERLERFYEAEEYHRQYYRKNPNQPYCQVIIDPKVDKLKKQFRPLLHSE